MSRGSEESLKVAEVAERLHVSKAYVYQLIHSGAVRGFNVSISTVPRWRVPVAEVERLEREGIDPASFHVTERAD